MSQSITLSRRSVRAEVRRTGLARRLLVGRLRRLCCGTVRLVDGDQTQVFGPGGGPETTVTVRHPLFYRRVLLGGGIGAGEAYIDGMWDCDDLAALCQLTVLNRQAIGGVDWGGGRLMQPLHGLAHALRRNSRKGSRRNIAAHYDLGNDFFRLFLDADLMYSSAVFPAADSSLEEASVHKLERICRRLHLGPSDHLLEIGTGWGGMALYAARQYGCRVTTTTISRRQWEFARQRVEEEGLQGRVEVLLKDYRDLDGRYDKLVSIEMVEAVGHAYYDTYFGQCSRLLAADGLMLLQAITIGDQDYEWHRRSVDFIKKYIFPGSNIPSLGAISASLGRATDLRVVGLEDIGRHYARTLRLWRQRFMAAMDEVRGQGFDASFCRMWEFYLAYCEGGFAAGYIADVHLLLAKPASRHEYL